MYCLHRALQDMTARAEPRQAWVSSRAADGSNRSQRPAARGGGGGGGSGSGDKTSAQQLTSRR